MKENVKAHKKIPYDWFAKLFSINLEDWLYEKTYKKTSLQNKYGVHLFIISHSDVMFKNVLILIPYFNEVFVPNSKR